MTPVTIEFDTKTIKYISQKQIDFKTYLIQLVKEDMLLSEIQESKKSGIYSLTSLDDLDK